MHLVLIRHWNHTPSFITHLGSALLDFRMYLTTENCAYKTCLRSEGIGPVFLGNRKAFALSRKDWFRLVFVTYWNFTIKCRYYPW